MKYTICETFRENITYNWIDVLPDVICETFRENITYNWIDVLPDVTESITDTVYHIHSQFDRRPNEINKSNQRDVYEMYGRQQEHDSPSIFKYDVGGNVCSNVGRHSFDNSYQTARFREIDEIVEQLN